MGKKKNKSGGQKTNESENVNVNLDVNEMKKEKENENKKKDSGEGEKKKESNPNAVVLRIDMHCEGCASKIIRCVRSFDGVESAKADTEANKLTVVGKVDPAMLRDKLAQKAKKKVDLLSPQPKKDNKADDKSDEKSEKNGGDKKLKEAPVTTAVLKVGLHCQGCVERIQKTVLKTKGVQEMAIDKQKELVTVKGTMDAKALAENLKEKLRRQVDIVPPKKEKEGDGEKKEGNDGGGGKKKGGKGGGGGGGGGGGDAGQEENAGNIAKFEGNRMEYMPPPGYGFGFANGHGFNYGYGYGQGGLVGEHLHAPQIFSDENPNACSVM